jgi:hypothetical protein
VRRRGRAAAFLGLWLASLVAIAMPVAAGADTPSVPDLAWWTTHSLVKVRPSDPPGTARSAELFAARNEFEPFQLVLRSQNKSLRGVDVEATDLVSRSGHRIGQRHVVVYLQHYLRLHTASSSEGAAGEWPDALLPRVDTYSGERRSAFPFALRPGRNQPLWIELYVPPGTPPGHYRGELLVSVEGARKITVPVQLQVWDFELPSTSTLRTSYGFSGISAKRQHYGGYSSDEALLELTAVYARAALRHRISIHGGSMMPPPAIFGDSGIEVDWQRYDEEVAPLLDGTIFGSDDPLPGARATSVDLRTPPALTGEERVLYWREWGRHFRERGWLDRLFVYLWDEPAGPSDYRQVLGLGLQARHADARLPTLLTEQLVPELAGVVDIWVTLIQCIENRPGVDAPCEETVPRAAYADLGRPETSLWWYQSCASHGCNIVGGDEFRGWPSYVIDAPAVAQRIMPWMAWLYGVEGELYFNTVEAYSLVADPWLDVRAHGGNGDGTLFFPGTPARIGGVTHVPVESLRLKLIREGLEDHAYLTMLDRAGESDFARRWVQTIVQRTYRWQGRPGSLQAARQALGEKLSEAYDAARRNS